MKMEIEITDADLRAAIERRVRVAIGNASGEMDKHIFKLVQSKLAEVADALVKEALMDTPKIKERIAHEIETQLRSKLTRALR